MKVISSILPQRSCVQSIIIALANWSLRSGAVVVVMLLAVSGSAHADFQIGRAINVAQWFTWPRYEPAPSTSIAWPPYKETPRPPGADDLRALKAAGFDTIRLPVDPAPFIVFEGDRREAAYKMLFDGIGKIRTAGLKVIVDLHPNSRHPVWGQHAMVAGLDAPAFLAMNKVVTEMARRLDKLGPQHAALELMNEPRLKCKDEQQSLWQQMLVELIANARIGSQTLSLIVSGACVSSLEGMIALDARALNDSNLIYTFHFYDPFSFTHQGAQFIPWPDKYLDEVPWPVNARPIGQPMARLEQRMQAVNLDLLARTKATVGAKANLQKLYTNNVGRETIEGRFAKAADWARRNGVPPERIFLGEFGVLRKVGDAPGALCEDRMRWLSDVRELSEQFGFSWAYFSYDGPFAIIKDETSRRLDPAVLASLDLKGGERRCPR